MIQTPDNISRNSGGFVGHEVRGKARMLGTVLIWLKSNENAGSGDSSSGILTKQNASSAKFNQ